MVQPRTFQFVKDLKISNRLFSAFGGGDRIRTRGLLGANEMLFQLSYAPFFYISVLKIIEYAFAYP
jgi:hypothetical protein